ncbi:MAG: peptide chain release factor N(5)-glutamine methyltransferase [Anaerolineales bacterium]
MSNKTIQEAWAFGRSQLAQASFTPEVDARLLLEYVLQVEQSYLIAHGDGELTQSQVEIYRALLARALQKEPIPYLTGTSSFYGFDLKVNSSVLIPRPETEELVEHAVHWVGSRAGLTIVDVGTGSGVIATALSRVLPPSTLVATDISFPALQVARINAKKNARQFIHFVQGDLLKPVAGMIDLIVANLPYIADAEWTQVDDGVKLYEPSLALNGGSDGLNLLRELLNQAAAKLRPGGAIFLEIGWQQGAAMRQLAGKIFPHAEIEIITDLAGQDRIVQVLTNNPA